MTGDTTERRDRERELERLSQLNSVIRQVNQELVRADSHKEVEQAVCDRLVDWDPYVFVWYGELDSRGAGAIEPDTWAGREEGYLSDLTVTLDDSDTAGGPAGRAIENDEVVVCPDIATDEDCDPWREDALERGYRSSVAVPVSYGDTRYGLVGLYADEPEAVSDDERAVLAELGESIGHAKNAILRKEGLVSDAVTRLELGFEADFDAAGVLSDESASADANLVFEDTVTTGDGNLVHYVSAEGFSEESVERLAETSPSITACRSVGGEDADTYEIHQSESALVDLLASHGGRVRELTLDGTQYHVVIELPPGVDIREFVDTVQSEFPDATLNAQRTVTREEPTDWELRTTVADVLTDKQHTALEAAYFAGYFAWPRESDGETVADSLDVSPSTFHQHLRAGERKLLDALFDS